MVSVVSERLQTVLDAGGVADLFPILKDWSTDELLALLNDIDEFVATSHAAIDRAWQSAALLTEVFFDPARSKRVDEYRDEKKMEAMMAASEISSVAIFYLHQRGVRVPGEEEWSR